MKITEEELSKTFVVEVDEASSFMELKFVSEDVGEENVDSQSDLIYKEITDISAKFPEIKWKILVDTATTKVHTMTLYSIQKYKELIEQTNPEKVAILVSSTEEQDKVAKFALETYAKFNKKVSLFTWRGEADLWLEL